MRDRSLPLCCASGACRLGESGEDRSLDADRGGDAGRLGAALLRINASLDVDTVLREVVESARALTGARYGAIVTVGGQDEAQMYVLSGFTAEEERELANWTPGSQQFFEHFRDLPGPLRMPDLRAYVDSLGLSEGMIACRAFQAMPMRHRDEHVGSFFLGEKAHGDQFTEDDEELLVLFASQAATAIANARAHRDEQRARAELEALIEASPVGVGVFDARTAMPLSFNREVARIVAGLGIVRRTPAEVVDVISARRADGREISFDDLARAEKVRGEEIELLGPDDRSSRVLVNVAPITSDTGDVRSVVVTMQDLAPLEELERSRAEFLGMVSHELRAPLTSIKGSAASALRTSRALDPAEQRQFFRIIDEQADRIDDLVGDLLDAGRIDSGTLSVDAVPADVRTLVDRARNTFLSGGGRHPVVIDLPAGLPRVLADESRIVQVLNNLFANAAQHAPEHSTIRVAAVSEGVHVAVSVADEGEGVPPDLLPRLFRKEVRRAKGSVGGAGLGLAICKGLVEAHGGRIWAESDGPGRGTRFTFTLQAVEEPDAERSFSSPGADRSAGTPILVVDDDPEALRYVRGVLDDAGYAPIVTGEPEEVADLIRSKRPRLVLLDLVLPGTDGIAMMDTVPELADLPVIFISAYGRDETVARALECGAVDYLVKPFSPTELAARVRAALRRAEPSDFALGDLSIDYARRLVRIGDRAVSLTPIEYELLRVLAVNAGRVCDYESLLRQVWRSDDTGGTQPVRDFVKKLRRKLGDHAADPAYILNVRGVGYRMREPGDAPDPPLD